MRTQIVTDDLLNRLRKRYVCDCTIVGRRCDVCNDRHKAADHIEHLNRKITDLDKEVEVLRVIVEHYKFLYEMQYKE